MLPPGNRALTERTRRISMRRWRMYGCVHDESPAMPVSVLSLVGLPPASPRCAPCSLALVRQSSGGGEATRVELSETFHRSEAPRGLLRRDACQEVRKRRSHLETRERERQGGMRQRVKDERAIQAPRAYVLFRLLSPNRAQMRFTPRSERDACVLGVVAHHQARHVRY